MRSGFSLVELSIVLVILGLLTGGILAGQSLIRASEMRAIGSEYGRWMTAVQSFRDKYMGLPGDLRNATKFWGTAAACPGTNATPSTTPATCDGDGNGEFDNYGTASFEIYRFWQHLANAGLIEGTYVGVPATSASWCDAVAPTNVPASKLSGAKWTFHARGTQTGAGTIFNGNYGNMFAFGGNLPACTHDQNGILKPEEAWNIDTKLDDGKPGTGRIWASNPVTCSNATDATGATANYYLSNSSVVCGLAFLRVF